jgi:hypothetical protein
LRHADASTTSRYYLHVIGSEQRDAAEIVARILCPDVAKADRDSARYGAVAGLDAPASAAEPLRHLRRHLHFLIEDVAGCGHIAKCPRGVSGLLSRPTSESQHEHIVVVFFSSQNQSRICRISTSRKRMLVEMFPLVYIVALSPIHAETGHQVPHCPVTATPCFEPHYGVYLLP